METSQKLSFLISFSCNNHSRPLLFRMLLHGPTTKRQVSSDLGYMTTLLLRWYTDSSSSLFSVWKDLSAGVSMGPMGHVLVASTPSTITISQCVSLKQVSQSQPGNTPDCGLECQLPLYHWRCIRSQQQYPTPLAKCWREC